VWAGLGISRQRLCIGAPSRDWPRFERPDRSASNATAELATESCDQSDADEHPEKWRSCLPHSDVVSAIVVEGDGLFRSQADKAVTAAMQKIDRSTSIVAETEQFGARRNSCLKSRARLSDGSERRFLGVRRKHLRWKISALT